MNGKNKYSDELYGVDENKEQFKEENSKATKPIKKKKDKPDSYYNGYPVYGSTCLPNFD